MIEVKVIVELPGIPDALNNLARAIAGSGNAASPSLIPAPVEQPIPVAAVPAPVAQPIPDAPVAPAAPAVPAAPVQAPVTLHALSVAGAKLVDMGKMDAVVKLLKQYGVAAITQLREDQYTSFAENLRGLGVEV